MQDKPFLTIDEQVELLASRGVAVDDDTADILLREGYYSVVNGYKDPFIDPEKTAEEGDDRFAEGTRFADIYALFLFDRDLRETTFHYLLRVEALVRTVCAYTFAEHHEDHDDYFLQSSFATEGEYLSFGLRNYLDNLHKLHDALHRVINHPRNEAIEHYKNEYGKVPVWVVMNVLTFGNIEHFFNLMKPAEQQTVCRRIAQMPHFSKIGYLEPAKMRRSLDVLVKFRNKCAHDERLYCATVDRRNPVDFLGCIQHASLFLSQADSLGFISSTIDLMTDYARQSGPLQHVMDRTGLSRLGERKVEEVLSGP